MCHLSICDMQNVCRPSKFYHIAIIYVFSFIVPNCSICRFFSPTKLLTLRELMEAVKRETVRMHYTTCGYNGIERESEHAPVTTVSNNYRFRCPQSFFFLFSTSLCYTICFVMHTNPKHRYTTHYTIIQSVIWHQ